MLQKNLKQAKLVIIFTVNILLELRKVKLIEQNIEYKNRRLKKNE